MAFKKIISGQICPNFSIQTAIRFFVGFCTTYQKKSLDFSEKLGTSNYALLSSARAGLTAIAKAKKKEGEKKPTLGVPAFICGVAVVPFLSEGYTIVWLDTDKNGLLSFESFIKKSAEISVLLCPHIFGQKLALEKFYKECQKQNILLVEDCAHLFITGPLRFCHARIWSFGREKVFSCVSGGAIAWKSESFGTKLKQIIRTWNTPSFWWKFRRSLQPLIYSISKKNWNIGAKVIPWFFQKIRFLPWAVSPLEKKAIADFGLHTMPVFCQKELAAQMTESVHTKSTKHRTEKAYLWKKTLEKVFPKSEAFLPKNSFRVILKTKNAKTIATKAKTFGFYLREWNGSPIAPDGVDTKSFTYTPNECKISEQFANQHLVFPTDLWVKKTDILRFESIFQTKKH